MENVSVNDKYGMQKMEKTLQIKNILYNEYINHYSDYAQPGYYTWKLSAAISTHSKPFHAELTIYATSECAARQQLQESYLKAIDHYQARNREVKPQQQEQGQEHELDQDQYADGSNPFISFTDSIITPNAETMIAVLTEFEKQFDKKPHFSGPDSIQISFIWE